MMAVCNSTTRRCRASIAAWSAGEEVFDGDALEAEFGVKCKVQRGGGQSIAELRLLVGHVVADDGRDHLPAGTCASLAATHNWAALVAGIAGDANFQMSSLVVQTNHGRCMPVLFQQLCSALVTLLGFGDKDLKCFGITGNWLARYVCSLFDDVHHLP